MSVEMESLSSILGESASSKGELTKAEPAPPAAEPKAEAPTATESKQENDVKEPVRDEAGRFTKTEAPKPPEAAKETPTRADIAAIIDERRKRQELEKQLAALQSGKPKTDFWENPEQALEERVGQLVNPLHSENLRLQVEIARLKSTDFDEVMMTFLEAAQKDPVLKAQADNSPDPLQFIYREGKRIKELGPYGGDLAKRDEAKFSEMKAELAKRDEQMKALQSELETLKKSQAELAAVPRSLNSLTSGTPKAADADPDDLSKIVKFK